MNNIEKINSKYAKVKGSFYFYYGTMGSSKSANLLMVAKNYEIQNKKTLVLKPVVDNRWEDDKVCSRAGVENRKAIVFNDKDDLYNLLLNKIKNEKDIYYAVLIDEAQFLTRKQVKQLSKLNIDIGIPILSYGLKNTYKDGELFEGSAALCFYADKMKEIKTVCFFCNSKATQNLMIKDNQPIYIGKTEIIGDIKKENNSNISYLPVCRKHYYNPNL